MTKVEKAYTIEQIGNCIQVIFNSGAVVSLEMIMEAVIDENTNFDMSGKAEIWDFRGCDPHPKLRYKTMEVMIEEINRNPAFHWSQAVAILVDSQLQFGFCRMFQTIAGEYQPNVGIFENVNEARQWIAKL